MSELEPLIEVHGEEEETSFMNDEYGDINQRFAEVFDRFPTTRTIRNERMKRENFVQRVIDNRPIFLSENFVRRDADYVFNFEGRRFTLQQYIDNYKKLAFNELYTNIENESAYNLYVEQFKGTFFDLVERQVKKEFESYQLIDRKGFEFKVDGDNIKLKARQGNSSYIVFDKKNGF